MLLGEAAAAELLSFVADRRIGFETDLDPIPARRGDKVVSPADAWIASERRCLQLIERQANLDGRKWDDLGRRIQ